MRASLGPSSAEWVEISWLLHSGTGFVSAPLGHTCNSTNRPWILWDSSWYMVTTTLKQKVMLHVHDIK